MTFVTGARLSRREADVRALPSTDSLRAPTMRFLSEPLFHFALLGALVFAGHRALARTGEPHTLEVSATKQRELSKLFEQRQHRPPTAADQQQLLHRYVEDEALFREGLRLSLVRTDPMLRAQLIARVRSLIQGEVADAPVSEAQLQSYFDAHRADFSHPETISYREYLFRRAPEASDAARRLSASLQSGAELTGPELPAPAEHARRTEADLTASDGPDLARRIWALPVGVWRELSSARGVHVVRVEEHAPAADPPLSTIREQVLAEYRKAELARAFQAQVDRLTAQWQVHLAEPL